MMTTDAIAQPGASAGALLVSKPSPPASVQGRPAFRLEPDGSDTAGREGGIASPPAADPSVQPATPMAGSQLFFGELSSPEVPLPAQPPVSVRSGDPLVLPPEPAVPIGFTNPPITDVPPVALAPPAANTPPDPAALAAQPDIGQGPPPLTGEPMGAGRRSGVVPSPQSVAETRASLVSASRSPSVTETVTGVVTWRDPPGVPTVGQPAAPPTSSIREPDVKQSPPTAFPLSPVENGAPAPEVSPRQKPTVADPLSPVSRSQEQAANPTPKPHVSNPPVSVPATGEVPRVQSLTAPAPPSGGQPRPSDEGLVSVELPAKPAPSVTGGSALYPRVQTVVLGPAQDVLPVQTTPTKDRIPQSPRATVAAPTAQFQLSAGPGEVSQPRDGMPIQTLDAPEPTGRDPITEKPGNTTANSAPNLQKGRDTPQPPQQTAAPGPGEPRRAERTDRRDGAPAPDT